MNNNITGKEAEIEGNKLIGVFHGARFNEETQRLIYDTDSMNSFALSIQAINVNIEEAKYHTSWDWQIPAWSKVVPLIQNILKGNLGADNKRLYLYERYELAVMQNNTADGFDILIQAIQWYNTHKSK